ncbi:MAG: hypothetical protein C0514_07355 [Candidatus Puniceispirillum sp.]|nr:hypothetical protein [Candidatus Puniceispirillum sp.]
MQNSSKFATVALAGLMTVGLSSSAFTSDAGQEKGACKGEHQEGGKEKHDCKGQNSCKGNGADGKNECKGQGSCKTNS